MVNIMRKIRNGQQTDGAAISSLTSMAWIPIAGLGFAVISTTSIAIMVVLSLIPIFTTTKDFPLHIQHLSQLNIIYRTDLINGSSLIIDNTNPLSSSLNNALHLYGIDNLTAQFISSITCNNSREYQTILSGQDKIINQNSMGDLLNFNFSAIYPKECYTVKCRQRYADKVLTSINTTYSNFSLSIQFTNGATSNVKLSFCSFNDYKKCQVNSGTCIGETNTCNEIETDEDCCLDDDVETDEDEDEDEEVCPIDYDDEDICQDEDEKCI